MQHSKPGFSPRDLAAFLASALLAFLVVVALSTASALAPSGCATLRPQIQEARDGFEIACRKLTAVMASDTPSKAERVASRVCLAEHMAATIETELVKDADDLGLFTTEETFALDAGK